MHFAMILFFHVANMDILENISMNTNTQLLPCLVEGRLDMYPMEIDSQG